MIKGTKCSYSISRNINLHYALDKFGIVHQDVHYYQYSPVWENFDCGSRNECYTLYFIGRITIFDFQKSNILLRRKQILEYGKYFFKKKQF